MHLTLLDRQVEVVESARGAEGLDDVVELDDGHSAESDTTFTTL